MTDEPVAGADPPPPGPIRGLSVPQRPRRPAYTRESMVLHLPEAVSLADLSPAWAWGGATGTGVRVAVIDSGIEADHPALDGCVDVESGVVISVDDDCVVETRGPHGDSFGHGTACAGIIHSFAPEARITSVKVLGEGLVGKAAAFLRGLGWAVEQGFEVINLSLGTNRKEWILPLHEVCDQAYFRGCVIVTAANNLPRPSYPSLFGSVLSVACNLATDPWRFHYNPDPPTEFLAPGIEVRVPWRGKGYITTTGNSFAAPHIAGLAALIRSKHPALRPFQVKTVLWATAANVQEAPRAASRRTGTYRQVVTSPRATAALAGPTRPTALPPPPAPTSPPSPTAAPTSSPTPSPTPATVWKSLPDASDCV